MHEVRIDAPLKVFVPRKTKADRGYLININSYRNWAPHENNNVKKAFYEAVKDQLKGVKFNGTVDIEFTLYKGSKRKTDKSNFYSILSKFLFDAMTTAECWEDDNDDIIKHEHQNPTQIDRNNPRGEFIIRSSKVDA